MDKFGKFVMGFLMGALVGAGASVLLAPYSGDRMRTEISNYFENASEEIRLAAIRKREELEIQLEEMRTPNKPQQ